MIRGSADAYAIVSDISRKARSTGAALSTTDGRWAVVSTTLTAFVAGSLAWLAAGAAPPIHARTQEASTSGFMPYDVFNTLVQAGQGWVSSPSTRAPAAPTTIDRALQDEEADDSGDTAPANETRTIAIESGETFQGILENAGVPSDDAYAAVAALTRVYDTRKARAGTKVTLTFEPPPAPAKPATTVVNVNGKPVHVPSTETNAPDADGADDGEVTPDNTPVGRLLAVSFSPTVEQDIAITRNADNTFTATTDVKELVAHTHRAGATINSSLYLAGTQAGIPTGIVVDLIKMFSYKVDFQRDLKPGDRFEVYYTYYYTPDGHPAREGAIDYALLETAGHVYRLYRYQPDANQAPEYFDENGANLKGFLMKTPVDGARISSGFGMRFHPILGYSRMHKGIDFAVPVGTPVMAAGTGTVVAEGIKGGYGNYMRIDLGNGYSVAYGHLSRFAPGLHVGSKVRQGEVVARSGNTGMSTGPHLHYEILVNGDQVNPLTVKVAQGRILRGKDLQDFKYAQLHIDAVRDATTLEARVDDAASDLRQAKAR